MRIADVIIRFDGKSKRRRFLAYTTFAICDDNGFRFVVNAKIVQGNAAPFVQMPTEEAHEPCIRCKIPIPALDLDCEYCQAIQPELPADFDMAKAFRDRCHPDNKKTRAKIHQAVMTAFAKAPVRQPNPAPERTRTKGVLRIADVTIRFEGRSKKKKRLLAFVEFAICGEDDFRFVVNASVIQGTTAPYVKMPTEEVHVPCVKCENPIPILDLDCSHCSAVQPDLPADFEMNAAYKDRCHPGNKETRAMIHRVVMCAFTRATKRRTTPAVPSDRVQDLQTSPGGRVAI